MANENENQEGTPPAPAPAPEAPAVPKKKKPPVALIVVIALVALGLFFGIRFVVWSKNHVATDDATVSSDVISVAPQVPGTVIQVLVSENQLVKKGQLLVELDDASYLTAVAQAQANYDSAVASTKTAEVNTSLTGKIGDAQIIQAQGQVEQNENATNGSVADVQRSQSARAAAQAQASGAVASVRGAEANLKVAIANKKKSEDSVRGALSVVANAQAAVKSAEANEAAALATYQKSQSDQQRAQTLLGEGAISAQEADQATAAFKVAEAQYHSAQEQVSSARSAVQQRSTEVDTARSQVSASAAAVTQAEAQVQAARDQQVAARENVNQADAQTRMAQTNVLQSQAKTRQSRGTLAQANTAPVQVEVSKTNQTQAEAKVAQALAALNDAKIQLARTKIYAPTDGLVSSKNVQEGALVQTGTPLMSVVPIEQPWVTANFKETQLADMGVGQKVEVVADALPGKTFEGHVESIAAGTGSTFALLPADNATGNFTKVVQRVPVKIVFEANQAGLEKLRVGMSVETTVTTDGGAKKPLPKSR